MKTGRWNTVGKMWPAPEVQGVTVTTWPGLSEDKTANTLGMSGRVWMSRMLPAFSTTTASAN
jgi:hypothetical protein